MCNVSKERISISVYSARLGGWRLGRARISRIKRGPPDGSNLAYLRSSTANSQVRSEWVFFLLPRLYGAETRGGARICSAGGDSSLDPRGWVLAYSRCSEPISITQTDICLALLHHCAGLHDFLLCLISLGGPSCRAEPETLRRTRPCVRAASWI